MKAKTLAGLTATILGMFCGSDFAMATPVSYSWSGVVNNVGAGFDPGVQVGQTIEISLTLDNSFSDQNPSPEVGSYFATPATPPLILSADIGGDTHIGSFQFVTVSDGSGGIDSVEISSSDQMTSQGFDILFQTDQTGVLDSDAIPPYIDPSDFTVATFSVERGSAFTEFLPAFGGTIEAAATPVPEPLTLSVFGAGLVCAILRRRSMKKRPRYIPLIAIHTIG
jgi:hypothetical protein